MANEIRTGIRLDGNADGAKAAFEQVEGGAKGARGEIDRTNNSSEQLAASFKKLISAVAGWQMARQFVETADAMTNMQSRMKMVTSGATEMAYVQGRLFDIAQQSRVSFLELGGTYAQIARATSALGVSQDRLLNVTDSIGQAMTISGGSAQSMQAALVQLSQGLASGTLRGEELNSIMEQTPRLAQAIADGMGISLGQLRAYGQDGKISALAVVEALEKAGPGLRREFEQVTVTVGGAMTALGNSGARFVNEFDKATGASSAMAKAIKSLGSGVDSLATSIGSNKGAWEILSGSASWAVSLGAVALVLPRVAAGVVMVGAAMAAHPVLLGLMAVAAIGGAIYAGYKKLNEVKPDTTAQNRADFMRFERGQQNEDSLPPYPGAKPIEEVRKYGKLVVDVQRETYDQSVQIAQSYQNRIKLASNDEERVALTKEMNDRLIQVNRDAQREIESMQKKDSGKKPGSDLAAEFINRLTTQYAGLNGQMSKTDEVTRQLDTSTGKFTAAQRAEALSLAQLIDERTNANKVAQEWTQQLQRQEQAQQSANDAFTANVIALDEQTRGYEFEISLLGRSTEEVQRLTAARNAKLALDRMLLDLQRQLDAGAITEQDALEREAALRSQANKALEEQLRLMDEVELRRRDMLAGARDGLRDYETTAARVGDATANAVKAGFKSMEDAAVSFARTGKLEMTAMANSIISDLLRIQIQKSITGPAAGFLQGLFGGGGGAVNTGTVTGADMDVMTQVAHTGGIAGGDGGWKRAASPAVFRGAPRFHTGGITGDEVPIIAKRGEGVFTPGQMKALGAGMSGPSVALNVTVINNTDAQVKVQQKPGSSGMELEVLVDMVDAGLADRAGAGQSRMGQAMAGRYGLREAVN